ncbi:MAG TPA: hypothetical protein VFH71_02385 [Rhodanobacteraceae bacterium]|nr:hypothetical protein [Rhodanobacteraceae bacterium]
MKLRRLITAFGEAFEVPSNIVRLDHQHTHGWQLRFGRWMFFADHTADGTGAKQALEAATEELKRRMLKLAAPTGIRAHQNRNKSNDLPVGVSGPAKRIRNGQTIIQYYFQVTYPVAGGKPANRSVYIGTENTITQERYDAALSKAGLMRDAGVRRFKLAATKAMRAEAES